MVNIIYGGMIAFLFSSHLSDNNVTWFELVMAHCRALILYVAAGSLQEALTALRDAQLPDTAAMFILACREIYEELISKLDNTDDEHGKVLHLPGLDPQNEDVIAVGEYFGQYQRKLVHLCMDSQPFSD